VTLANAAFTRGGDRSRIGVSTGLLVAALLLTQTGNPPTAVLLCLILVVTLLFASLRWDVGILAILLLVFAGVVLRYDARFHSYSDVLTVTRAAIDMVLAGGNPYGHGFDQSTPPGAPFAYGPVSLLWYLPFRADPGQLEFVVSFLILALLALRGRVLGLAIYATLPALVSSAGDGSNDTSMGLLLLITLLVSLRAPRLGAVLLAICVAFKLYALAWFLPLIGYAGVSVLVPFVAASVICWGPALVTWGASSIAWSLQRADSLHSSPYWSLAYGLQRQVQLPEQTWSAIRYAAGVVLAVASLVAARSDRSFILAGAAVFLATLFLGWWSTYAYLAALAPILCWSLDDWLDLGRVRLPDDLIGDIETRVDRRWPVRRPFGGTAQGGTLQGTSDPEPLTIGA
jgi:hypothetical protein